MANGWTLERRQKQAEMIKEWRPWKQSTGPKTEKGKRVSSGNAFKGGVRPNLRELTKILRGQREKVTGIENDIF